MMMIRTSVRMCVHVKDSKAEGGKEEGEPSTTSIASTFVYLERPPAEGERSWCTKKSQDGIFCIISFRFGFSEEN